MRALDRKLLRDLRLMWSQALTIALVVASGLAGFLTSLSAVDSLENARDAYYAEGRFAEVFGSVRRAPLALVDTLRAVPGVAEVQPGISEIVRVTVPGSTDPVLGQLIGLDPRQPPALNRVTVVAGRGLGDSAEAGSAGAGGAGTGGAGHGAGSTGGDGLGVIEALVSQGFAQARGLRPGATVQALVNGRQRTLKVVGWAVSPEFIFAGLFGSPDQRGFGVWWIDQQALAAAYDLQGAFNTLAVRLAPASVRPAAAAGEAAVIEQLAVHLARYGGAAPVGREHQTSHTMLDGEIKQQRLLGTVLPLIFLGVAAFLLNVVVSRLVATQREQIAALKALGYTHRAIATHYLQLVLAIVAVGLLLGTGLGAWLGRLLMGLYGEVFRFPPMAHGGYRLDPGLVLAGALISAGTAVAGTLSAILATVRLTPAEAMRPPAPGRFRPTLVERLGFTRLSPALRMVLRNLERRPWRTALGVLGVAAAVAIVVMGNFFRDAIDVIVETEFDRKMRSDVSVWLTQAADAPRTQAALAHTPQVLAVQGTRFVQATVQHGHRSERLLLRGMPQPREDGADPNLYRVVDLDGRVARLPDDGLLITDRLARKLGVRVGELLQVTLTEGRRRTLWLPLRGLVGEMMGLNAYISREGLNAAMGDGDLAGGFVVLLERGQEPAFLAATQGLPRITGAFSKASMLANMREVTARNILIMSGVLTAFASVIAIGVVYNNARIALAERAWELASLRVLGFSRGEVTAILLGEMAIVTALALPLGMALGWGLVRLVAHAMQSDQFAFPVVVQPRTYAVAALAVLLAAAGSAAVVRRRIHRIDMVSALKTRD